MRHESHDRPARYNAAAPLMPPAALRFTVVDAVRSL
jgi:hypothetical protein